MVFEISLFLKMLKCKYVFYYCTKKKIDDADENNYFQWTLVYWNRIEVNFSLLFEVKKTYPEGENRHQIRFQQTKTHCTLFNLYRDETIQQRKTKYNKGIKLDTNTIETNILNTMFIEKWETFVLVENLFTMWLLNK